VDKKKVLETKPPYHSFLFQNPHTERLAYYNEIIHVLFEETAGEFRSLERFHNYLIIQRRWMYDTSKEVSHLVLLLTVCNPVKTMVKT